MCTRVGDLRGGVTESQKIITVRQCLQMITLRQCLHGTDLGQVSHTVVYIHARSVHKQIYIEYAMCRADVQLGQSPSGYSNAQTVLLTDIITCNHQMADANDKDLVSVLYLVIICFPACMRQQQSDFEAL